MPVRLIGARYWSQGIGQIIRPASAMDEAAMATLPQGRLIAVEIETADAPKARQFYFGLIAKLVEAGVWNHKDRGDMELMIRADRVGAVDMTRDRYSLVPVSKAGWQTQDWREYLDQVIPIVMSEILPEVPWPAVRMEIERYCGVRLSDALREVADAHGD